MCCEIDPNLEVYRDYFALIFMLIGINVVDLVHLQEITPDGRIEYHRAKTHKLYSIKVEPEALVLIEKHKGIKWLLSIMNISKIWDEATYTQPRPIQVKY